MLAHLIKNGSERVVTSAREHIYDLRSLESYHCVGKLSFWSFSCPPWVTSMTFSLYLKTCFLNLRGKNGTLVSGCSDADGTVGNLHIHNNKMDINDTLW